MKKTADRELGLPPKVERIDITTTKNPTHRMARENAILNHDVQRSNSTEVFQWALPSIGLNLIVQIALRITFLRAEPRAAALEITMTPLFQFHDRSTSLTFLRCFAESSNYKTANFRKIEITPVSSGSFQTMCPYEVLPKKLSWRSK